MVSTLDIPLIAGETQRIPLTIGIPLFIIGPNGSGKSALIQHAVTSLGATNVRRISAHRQTWLQSGSIDLTPQNRRQFDEQLIGQEPNPEYRWREWNPQMRLSSVLFDLTAKENTLARTIMKHAYDGDIEAVKNITNKEVPVFTQINELLAIGRLAVKIENADGEQILARHKEADIPYSIAQMSDGERNAVIIAANALTVDPGTVLLIDEPERHLHRSIIEPFLSALFSLRADCPFMVSTHEIELPIANPGARAMMIRSCRWRGDRAIAWDIEMLEEGSNLPDDLKRSILGSRRRILFVEGEPHKLDKPLYEALFPYVSVIPKGSSNDVIAAVRGLRNSSGHHHVEAFGLIDKDFRSAAQIANLSHECIFALDVYSAESLYYCLDAIDAVARHQAESYGFDAGELRKSAKREALHILNQDSSLAERMAARRSERIVRDHVLEQLPDWKSIHKADTPKVRIEIDSPYTDELSKYNALVADENVDEIIAKYPIRESSLPNAIVRALKISRDQYERLLPRLVNNDTRLAEKMKQRIRPLADILARDNAQIL